MLHCLPACDATDATPNAGLMMMAFSMSIKDPRNGVPDLNQERNGLRRLVGNDGDLSTSSPPKEALVLDGRRHAFRSHPRLDWTPGRTLYYCCYYYYYRHHYLLQRKNDLMKEKEAKEIPREMFLVE